VATTGAKVIKRRMRLIVRNVRDEISEALDEAAEDLRGRSQGLAPQLEGDLIGSAEIKSHRKKNLESRKIFYDSPYAVVRHEDFYNLGPVSSVKKSPDGPIGRKYLSRPFDRNKARYKDELANAMRRGIRQSMR